MFLTNFEIISICKSYGIPLVGCFMKDEMPKLRHDGNYIINLDSSNHGGSHWTCLVIHGKDSISFDSFGCVPPTEVEKFIHGKYGFNNWIIQDLKSTNCGFFCIGLFLYLKQHDGNIFAIANNYVNLFQEDTKKSDSILKKYFSKQIKNNIVTKKLLFK